MVTRSLGFYWHFSFFVVLLIALICNAATPNASAYELDCSDGCYESQPLAVLNNGGSVVQVGNTVYLLHKENPQSYEANYLESMEVEEGIPRLLIKGGWDKIFYLDGNILFTEPFKTYSYNIASGEVSFVSVGKLCFVDEATHRAYLQLYSWDEDGRSGLYSVSIDGTDPRSIVTGDYYFCTREGNTIYCYGQESGRIGVYSVNLDGTDLLKISTEVSIYSELPESLYWPSEVFDIGICGDRIIYSYGNLEGSGAFFYGFLVSVKKNGEDKKVIGPLSDEKFSVSGGWLYRNYWGEGELEDGPYFIAAQRMTADFSSKEEFADGTVLSEIKDGYRFIIFEKREDPRRPDLYVSDPDGSNAYMLVNGRDYWDEMGEYDYGKFNHIEIVGDWVYFDTQVWGYRDNSGWRDELIHSEFNRIRLDRAGFWTFNRYFSGW